MFVAELPSNSDAKSKEEKELMNDRNINKFLEGVYKAVCEALNSSLKTAVQLNSLQLQIIDLANTSSLRNDCLQYVTGNTLSADPLYSLQHKRLAH
jgi:hypothetical protein